MLQELKAARKLEGQQTGTTMDLLPVGMQHFVEAFGQVLASVKATDLAKYMNIHDSISKSMALQ